MAQSGAAREALEREFPGVGVLERGERVTAVFGRPMTRGATARAAMEDWMDLYQPVFGVDELEWIEHRGAEISNGRIAFALRQEVTVEGGILAEPTALPVENGRLRALVAPDGEDFVVTYIAARVVDTDGGIAAPQITGPQAIAAAGEDERTRHLEVWGAPELVVVEMDLGVGPEVFASWRLVGQENEEAWLTSLIVHVDAVTGEVVAVNSGVLGGDPIEGTVNAKVTSGLGPPLTSTVATQPLPDLTVSILGENSTTTDDIGDYQLETSSSSVDVRASLSGTYWTVADEAAGSTTPTITETGVTPPAFGLDFPFNSSPSTQEATAPFNAFLNVQRSNDLFRDKLPTWTSQILPSISPLNVLVNSNCQRGGAPECNAFYGVPGNTPQLTFCLGVSGVCNNSAYSTIVSHEYGHYIAHQIIGEPISSGSAFHEGYADSLAILVHDTAIIAQGYHIGVQPDYWRNLAMADVTYPACADGPFFPQYHHNGQLLGRLWWDIRNDITPPVAQPIEATRQLFADWTMIAGGSATWVNEPGCEYMAQPADVNTLIEVLTADDDDSDLSNGTPNDAVICAAFSDRGIDSPPGLGLCGSPLRGGACRADLNYDGTLDGFDYLEFERMFALGDMFCDFDGDGQLDVFDFLCFQNAFAAGCP